MYVNFQYVDKIGFAGGSAAFNAISLIEIPSVYENWLAFAAVADGTATGKFYNKGDFVSDINFGSAPSAASSTVKIGWSNFDCNGYYDEFRIRKATSSATWVKAEYETITASDFITYGRRRTTQGATIVFR